MSRWSAFEPIPLPTLPLLAEIDAAVAQLHVDEARVSALETSDQNLRADLDKLVHEHDDSLHEIKRLQDNVRTQDIRLSLHTLWISFLLIGGTAGIAELWNARKKKQPT